MILDPITDPFAGEIARRALTEVLLLAAICGPLGVWVVLYRQSYAAESVAHAALPGLVLASVAGFPLLLGAAAGLVVAAVAVGLVGRARGVDSDSAVAVLVTTMFGAGVILALSPDTPARLGEILFGDPLGVSYEDILATAILGVLVFAGLTRFHRRLSLVGFDSQSAPVLGASPAATEIVLLVLLALTILIAVQALGNLLVIALILAPGAAALRVGRRLPAAMALSVAFAAGAGLAGLYASHYLHIAAGAAIALAAVVTFAVTLPRRAA